MPTQAPGYLIRKLSAAQSVPCPCGISTRPLPTSEGAPCSLHVTTIQDSVRHYHRDTTEVYYILEGSGKMELNGDWVAIEPGDTIWIEPGTRHRVVGEQGGSVKTIVFSIPAFQIEDEYFD